MKKINIATDPERFQVNMLNILFTFCLFSENMEAFLCKALQRTKFKK